MSSAYAQVLASFIRTEELYSLPIGSVLKSMGERPASTRLLGAGEMFRWMKTITPKRLVAPAARLARNGLHHNVPIADETAASPEMVVY